MEPELERLYEVVSDYFGLLAEPTRLKILNSICDGERSVSDIVERVGATQTNVSRHLNLMYDKGVLKRRREGQMTLYSVADPNVVTLCRAVCVHMAGQLDEHPVSSRIVKRFMPSAAK
ncbi:MAG: metalloregulator ArsR/SmtB family transcription factor [Burkholderiaceae bacterium]|jgi:DNA-binding transcriptional ArsR family regulator|nr:metalloregulator ArsR/SmtB family transcription factor [Burkholderiaceae bacterium]